MVRQHATSLLIRGGRVITADEDTAAAAQRSRSDYNLYEGTEVVGSPSVVILRGQVLVEHDRLAATRGAGRFIRRARVGTALERNGEARAGG